MAEKEYIEREALLEQLEIAFDKEGKKADECAERKMHDAAVKYGHGQYCYLVSKTMVKEAPAADVVEVVRCKDCKYYKRNGSGYGECPFFDEVKDDEYCSSGEAKMDGKGEGE